MQRLTPAGVNLNSVQRSAGLNAAWPRAGLKSIDLPKNGLAKPPKMFGRKFPKLGIKELPKRFVGFWGWGGL